MDRDGLLIGEVVKRAGASRKALRLYERAGILPPPRRTQTGYRVYDTDTLAPGVALAQPQTPGQSGAGRDHHEMQGGMCPMTASPTHPA